MNKIKELKTHKIKNILNYEYAEFIHIENDFKCIIIKYLDNIEYSFIKNNTKICLNIII